MYMSLGGGGCLEQISTNNWKLLKKEGPERNLGLFFFFRNWNFDWTKALLTPVGKIAKQGPGIRPYLSHH